MYGNVYFSLPLANSPTGNGVTCVDLRTGETKWTRTDLTSVNIGQLLDFESANQHGVNPNGYLWIAGGGFGGGASLPAGSRVTQPSAAAVAQLSGNYAPGTSAAAAASGSTTTTTSSTSIWMAIDPMTGANVFNETNVPSGTRAQGPMGEWLQYAIGRPNNNAPYTYLWQWNNTKYPGQDSVNAITAWGAVNANYNMSAAYDWNVTLSEPLPNTQATIGSVGGFGGGGTQDPVTGVYTLYPSIVRIFPGNLIFGQSTGLQLLTSTSSGVFGTPDKYTLWAINLNSSRGAIGKVLFQKQYNAPPDNLTAMIGPADGESNVFTMYYRETMQFSGYNMLTGDFLWGPTASQQAWNFYGGTTGLTAPYAIGYGNLYCGGYSGRVYAYDLKTGKTLFVYGSDASDPKNSSITVNTVYGDYPTQVCAVADGKVYMVPCEHSLDSPPYHGAQLRCIDAFTGKEQWKLLGMSSWQMQAVADGYWATLNLNDMQVYSIGPGPSATTVNVKNDVIALGGSIEITGTVTDQSPALKNTPAIADADQELWMEYMIQHNVVKPNAQGVPVKLTAKDPNGNIQDIGTVTSDSNGLFHKLWQPPVPGEYIILAEFEGSLSYGGSSAATAIGVTAAPAPVVTPTPTPATPTPPPTATATPTIAPTSSPSPTATTAPPPGGIPESTIYAIAAAVIIVVVVAIAAVVLRKRK
jgi:outer membrane protein assembly factor BamB